MRAVLYFVSDMQSRDYCSRDDAIEWIAALGPRAKAAVPALRKELDYDYASVQGEAAWALYVITGDTELPMQTLLQMLDTNDWWQILMASRVIARLGPIAKQAVPALRECLEHEDSDARRYAALALGYIGPAAKPAIPKLKELLDDHESSESSEVYHVSRHAAAALAFLDVDTPKVAELLGKVIKENDINDGNTRPGAHRYAWKYGGMDVDEVVDRLVVSLDRPNWGDTLPMIRLLGEIGPHARKAVPALRKLADRRYDYRIAAHQAIALIHR